MTLAVIMKLRKRVGLLVGVIAVAIVAFLAMDAINSQSNLFGGDNQNVIGEVNGQELSYQDFESTYNHWLKRILYFQGYWQQQGFSFSEEERMQIREAAWENLVLREILNNQYAAANIELTETELDNNLYSPQPRPEVQNFYTQVVSGDQNAPFNPQQMRQVVQQVQSLAPDDPSYPARDFYEQLLEVIRTESMRNKFLALFARSVYVPDWKAQLEHERRNTKASINFVSLPYSSIADEDVTPTDEELQSYLNKHQEEFGGDANRSMEYVVFDILPTKADSVESLNNLSEKWNRMLQSGRDSMFINQYSLTAFRNGYYPKDEILTTMADTLFVIDTNTWVGPYVENGRYRYVKLYNRKTLPDSVQVRTVFASTQVHGSIDSAMNTIDSARALYALGTPFDTLAARFSDDQASARDGGNLGWFKPSDGLFQGLFKAFFTAGNEVGTPFTVETPAGVHFAEITAKGEEVPMVKYNIMDQEITPGSKTKDSVYSLASRFYTRYGTPDSFEMGTDKFGMNIRYADNITASTYQLPGLSQPVRELVRWAFEEPVGTINLFNSNQLGEDKYLVAHLTGARTQELTVDDIREQLTTAVIREKKKNQLRDQLASASAGASSMDQIASKLNVDMNSASDVNFNSSMIQGVGSEPVLAGTAVALGQDQISPPIEGQNGVYLVQQTSFTEATPTEDYTLVKAQMRGNLRSRFGGTMLDQLRQMADVVDQRYKYY